MIEPCFKMYGSKGVVNETLINWHLLKVWILFERHYSICNCSYCREPLNKFQIRLPSRRYLFSGWKVIAWRYRGNKYYLRIY